MPILHAPILEQAGFVKSALEPVKSYAYRLDGVDQYFQLSEPINLLVNDEITFQTARDAGPAATKQWFASGTGLRINVQANNKIEEVGGDLYLDGVLVQNYITEFPVDGLEHNIKYDITSTDVSLVNLGASITGFELLSGYVRKLVVKRNGTVINEIPLTNKAQGATQLPTVGSVSAAIVGYNENDWEEV